MPTERFHKLPEDKRRAICQAAVDEFSRVPFDKVSINKIIFNAGISRGSFYTYFEDKKDVLVYIFKDSVESLMKTWLRYLEENAGNIWVSSELLMEYIMQHARASNMCELMKNLNFSQDLEAAFFRANEQAPCGDYGKHVMTVIQEKTDCSNLCLKHEDSFERLFQMIFMTMMSSLGWYYKKPETEENIKKSFHEVLEILQYGICKQ